ncbi:Endoglucanase-7 [Dactylella cylindrospora]|nr:Endoglucanase-7 [Dactylella cylindrospora]
MKFSLTTLLAVTAMVPQALAHYNFDRLIVGGTITGEYEYVRRVTNSNSPVTDVNSNDLRCNVGHQGNAAATKIYKVTAGSTVGFTVRDVIGHPGPLFAYLSKSTTANVTTYDGSGDWFKIYELGVKDFATYTTAMTWKSDGFTSFTFTIPRGIQNGQYLLRGEHIAVHGSGSIGGAQFYMSCAQIEISGGTGATPSPVGKIPGIYKATDPGIYFNPYWPPVTNYTMPGPAVYSG